MTTKIWTSGLLLVAMETEAVHRFQLSMRNLDSMAVENCDNSASNIQAACGIWQISVLARDNRIEWCIEEYGTESASLNCNIKPIDLNPIDKVFEIKWLDLIPN